MFLVLPSYIIQDLSFLQSALFVSGCPREHPFCARGPFIPAGPPPLHWASVSIWCQNAVFSHCSTRHRHQLSCAPLGARVAQCPVACRDVGERPSSCCVRFCWEAVQGRVSWALVFCTRLFFAKVLSCYTFPYAGLGSEKWSNAKRHAGLRTLHLQWSYLRLRFSEDFMFSRWIPRPGWVYHSRSWWMGAAFSCSLIRLPDDTAGVMRSRAQYPAQHWARPCRGQDDQGGKTTLWSHWTPGRTVNIVWATKMAKHFS